jgi:hypothetical protein
MWPKASSQWTPTQQQGVPHRCEPVWLNVWQYSHIDALKLGLAHQFKAYLSEKNREKSIPLRFCPKYQLAGNHSINF